MTQWYDTLTPYSEFKHNEIQYSSCFDFSHISRYRNLRTVSHTYDKVDNINGNITTETYTSLETPNKIFSNMAVVYYTVRADEENRLDLIAYKYLGSAEYSWVISYLNEIHDGYTVMEGQRIKIPASRNVLSFLDTGEMLAPVNATLLNLGSE